MVYNQVAHFRLEDEIKVLASHPKADTFSLKLSKSSCRKLPSCTSQKAKLLLGKEGEMGEPAIDGG